MCKRLDLNFIGNVEGHDLFHDHVDVVICDGFVGNVVLKLTEGLVDGLFKAIKQELMNEMLLAMRFKSVMKKIYKKMKTIIIQLSDIHYRLDWPESQS